MTRHAGTPCPTCRKVLDASTHPTDETATPSPGDATVCAYCATVLIYDTDMRLRRPTDAEYAEMARGELGAKVVGVRALVQRIIRHRSKDN